MNNICEYCKKEFKKTNGKQRFCCSKCWRKNYYNNNKEKIKEVVKRWELLNPERRKKNAAKAFKKFRTKNKKRFNSLVMKNYYNNKDKWICRDKTREILKNWLKKYGENNLKKECKICRKKKTLEIHHEKYHTKVEEILKDIRSGHIYYLCMECHKKLGKELRINKFINIKHNVT